MPLAADDGSAGAVGRLFVAAWPPPPVVDQLGRLPRPEIDGVRWTRPDQWHVTLQFLNESSVPDMARALARIEHPPVEVEAGPATELLGGTAIVLPVAGLTSLADAAMAMTGLVRVSSAPPPARAFVGHLTIGRLRRRGDTPGAAVGIGFRARWVVDEIALVRSALDPGGAAYETVATQRLSGARLDP